MDFGLFNKTVQPGHWNEVGLAQPLTLCIINGGAQCKFVVLVFKQRLVSWDSDVQVGLDISLRSIFKPS